MNKINKANYFILLTSLLFGVDNPDPIDLDQIFTEDINSRVLNCVLRQGYFPSVPTGDQNLETQKKL